MFALAAGKAHTGKLLANPVLITEGRVTTIDGLLAVAVLAGLVLNTTLNWWWADPIQPPDLSSSTTPSARPARSSPTTAAYASQPPDSACRVTKHQHL